MISFRVFMTCYDRLSNELDTVWFGKTTSPQNAILSAEYEVQSRGWSVIEVVLVQKKKDK
ncbi:hypothetical protein [Serratia liquefaciens]|uniref:hypothetical protein n=1 Tax=Serratia liquefaciens TaxID=614 RepID=UPI003905F2A1